MKRINSRLDSTTTGYQEAAYCKNRSTIEYAFATKLKIGRTMPSRNGTIYVVLLEMKKALNSIHINTIIEDLKNTLNQDELHLIWILLDLKILAKYSRNNSKFFNTNTRAPQGDCASPSEFTFYLIKLHETTNTINTTLEDHNTIQDQISKSNYTIIPQNYLIEFNQ